MIAVILLLVMPSLCWAAPPVLNFSDITSGPKTGNTDGVGSGAIVTIWGNNLGSSQGTSKVYVGGVEATAVYYWKDADGTLPGGPANLHTFHKMQEIAFAVPAGAPDGATTIKVTVGGVDSTTLPFLVRSGNIYFIKSGGNDSTGTGSWSSPWATIGGHITGGAGSVAAGDIIYSVGVGSNAQVLIGGTTPLIGTLDTPFVLAVYPNTTATVTTPMGTTAFRKQVFTKYIEPSAYWNFSKWTVNTGYEAFAIIGYARYIGNKVTGATTTGGYSGWVGGNCDPTTMPTTLPCSGHKLLGNEVYEYGDPTGTSVSHHLIYISNRTGTPTLAPYEVGWNYFHENKAYQGIHVYDTSSTSPITGIVKIHDNVVRNQAGNAINLNNPANTTIHVWNNLTILDTDYNPAAGGYTTPKAALRVECASSSIIKIWNNTFYGYNETNKLASSSYTDFVNNIVIDNRNLAYSGAKSSTSTQSNNLFFSTANAQLALPSWASGALNKDPLFSAASSYNFSLQSNSPALAAGYNTSGIAPFDFLGNYRTATPAIGAFDVAGSAPVPVNGVCGPSNLQARTSAPTIGLCSAGTESAVSGTGPWTWTCSGQNGGTTASCSAPLEVVTPSTDLTRITNCSAQATFR